MPEIALTHPVAQAFRCRFGPRVTVLHSGLSEAARLDQWRRIILGQVDVVVGARSAVFAPLPRLGLVVVDEEHDPAYKQEGGLLYQARDVALYRGKLAAATVVLVSATPQITTYHLAITGKYHYLNLSRRVTPQDLPEIHLIDLKAQRGDKAVKIISRPLLTALEEVLSRKEQALLFLNRRGYARALFCLFCGHVFQCRQCSVALTRHQQADRLICHYCGFSQEVPETCPQCQATAIKQYGVGTEKVESEVRRLLPGARVARLDRDTAPHSGKALAVFESFAAGDLDLLVGTQMIAKGHHFPPGHPGGGGGRRPEPLFPGVSRRRAHLPTPLPGGRPGRPGRDRREGLGADLPTGALRLPDGAGPGFRGVLRTGDRHPPRPGLSALHPPGPGQGQRPPRPSPWPGRPGAWPRP